MVKTSANTADLPDWWQREKQRRQLWFLIFLTLLLTLIAYYYWVAGHGRIGSAGGVNFDSTGYVAFVHQDKAGNADLYAVRADGTDLRRLTDADDKSNKQDPTWTADGKSLIYSSSRSDKVMQLYVLGSGQPLQLTYGAGNKFAPAASPDGKTIAFVTQGAVKTVLLNGNDVRQVMPAPHAEHGGESDLPSVDTGFDLTGPYLRAGFSSDGTALAAAQTLNRESLDDKLLKTLGDQIGRVIPPGGGQAENLDTGREVSLAWEPNGARLASAFMEQPLPPESPGKPTVEVVSGIHLWRFDTANHKPEGALLFLAPGYTAAPRNLAWSPDGKHLAFECWRLQSEDVRELRGIVVMEVGQPVQIRTPQQADTIPCLLPATPGGKPMNPRWSPDGARLLYEMARPDGRHDLCVINGDGTNPLDLTAKLGGDCLQGAWSPARK